MPIISITEKETPIIRPDTFSRSKKETSSEFTCSTIICGNNEQCQEDDDGTYCQCLPNYYHKKSTGECIIKYQWVNYTVELFDSFRLVYVTSHPKHPDIVGRLIYKNGDKVPLQGMVFDNKTDVLYDQSLKKTGNFEVLAIEFGTFDWIESRNGIERDDAIEGGKIENELVYVCRVTDGYRFYAGVMQPSNHSCYVQSLNEYAKNYQLLVHKSDSIPGVKFEIFFSIPRGNKCIAVISKKPCDPVSAIIRIQSLSTDESVQFHVTRWINDCTLKCDFEIRPRRNSHGRSLPLLLLFQCDITWHSLKKLQQPIVSNIHGQLKNFLIAPDLSDMTIVIGEKEISVHQIILAAYSPVFSAMFKADMMESANKRIVMTDTEVEIMEKVIEFMYTGVIVPIPDYDALLSIFEVADMYEIMDLKELCEQKLSEQVTLENVLYIFDRVSLFEVPHLKEALISFMAQKKLEIIELDDFAVFLRKKPDSLLEFVIRSILSH
ncbi:hypothetical protein PV326_007639 [Microctonus aethiopoides]|nr:hypothetical protein PV326_007639 [Microctonus aethiopoides]